MGTRDTSEPERRPPPSASVKAIFRLLHAQLMGDALYDDPDPELLEALAGERGRLDQCERVTL